jgi:hypothetical protein
MAISSWAATAMPNNAAKSKYDHIDAMLWCAISIIALSTIQIGAITGDGLVRSSSYEQGSWIWNPNHLLMDPVGALWHKLLTALGSTRPGPDQQKLLSIWSGAIAIALFRWRLAPLIASSRLVANHATAWLSLGSAFSRLWISDKTPMTQMPFLVLAAVALLEFSRQPQKRWALAAGLSLGVATLFFVSNVVLTFALALAVGARYAWRRRWGEAIIAGVGIGGGAAGVASAVFLLTWMLNHGPETSFFHWLTNYAGGEVSERAAGSYGINLSLLGIVIACARALYGAASAIVDMAPAVQFWRDRDGSIIQAYLTLAAGITAGCTFLMALWRQKSKSPEVDASASLSWITVTWTCAVIVFGILWNDSDDQFYLQLAVPIGVLMATLHTDRKGYVVIALSTAVLSFNAARMVTTYVMYPRDERVAALESATANAGLVVYPGYDEIGNLLYFTHNTNPDQRLSITQVALKHEVGEGMNIIKTRVQDALAQGHDVVVLSLYDVPPDQSPWKYVRRLGYDRVDIISMLNAFAIDGTSQKSGPFTIRWIRSAAIH